METETAEIDIAASPEDTWALVGDFGGIGWMPGIDSVSVDGDVRTISMSGMEIKEQLVSRDDAARSITYSITDGPVPVESHQATQTVTAAGDGSHVAWEVSVAPEGAAFFRDVYQGALGALKERLEG